MTWGKRRAIIIMAVVLFFILMVWAISQPMRFDVMRRSVLVIDATGDIEEQHAENILSAFSGGRTPVLHDYLDAIDSARVDSRITGIVVRIAPLETGWGKIEEIRTHLLDFQKGGKPSVCYLGYDGVGNLEYYLASACREIWLVPTTPVGIRGMMAEAMFFRGSLDKLKIVPEYYHIAEFKTATNELTEKKFTPAHKEEMESLLWSVYHRYVSDTAAARHMDPKTFESLIERGPLSSSEAVEDHIVDRLGYWDQVQDYFQQRVHAWNPISVNRYKMFLKDDGGFGAQTIAVVHATGLIASGSSQNTAGGGFIMGGDSVAADLRAARENPMIRAIVLRIDSGGGSVVASEVIRREVQLAREEKPVVVSMSDVAASGGYWIAAPATKIVADPDTETGSIGVLMGKMNISGLYNLLGISTDYVTTGDNATLYSSDQNFSPAQEASIQKSLTETYEEFTEGVAEGRHMSVEAVKKIAKGRVWTGEQAKQIGLVDELGGIDRAIEVAKQLAHIPANESVHIARYPEEKNFWQLLFEKEADEMSESESLEATVRRIAGTLDPVQARVEFQLRIR
jgi:protease IV